MWSTGQRYSGLEQSMISCNVAVPGNPMTSKQFLLWTQVKTAPGTPGGMLYSGVTKQDLLLHDHLQTPHNQGISPGQNQDLHCTLFDWLVTTENSRGAGLYICSAHSRLHYLIRTALP